jgi:type IV pilus assembly protein PilW
MAGLETQQGFTLLDLLLALALSSLLLAGIYNVFISQQKVYSVREQVAEMQQNARAGMDMMTRELRMAGYDPTGAAGASIVIATATTIQCTMDLNNDGDLDDDNEDVTYTLYDADSDGDQDLGRDTGGGNQPIAENIQSLTFVYTLANGSTTSTPADPNQIRVIRVSLTAQTAKRDPDYSPNNGHRTTTLTAEIDVRNMGL